MPDIEIVRRRDRAYFFAETDAGRKFIVRELILMNGLYTINIEYLDDMLEFLTTNEITFEIK